jgi:hypothetical protein
MLRRHWPSLLVAVLFLAAVLPAAARARAQTGNRTFYPLDDTYIQMTVAKNLAERGVWGSTRFGFSSPCSSLTWPLALAMTDVVAGVSDVTPLVLNILFAVCLMVVVDRALARCGLAPFVRTAVIAEVVIEASVPGMVLMGMEHVLHLALTIGFAGMAALEVGERPAPSPRRIAALSVLAALLAATRYEALFLVGVVCICLMAIGRARHAVIVGGAAVIPLAAFGLISVSLGSNWLPNPLLMKAGGTSASLLSALVKPVGEGDLESYRVHPRALFYLQAGVLAAILNLFYGRSWRHPSVLLPIWLVVCIVLHGHFVFSSTFWAYRYDAYLAGFGIVAIAVAAAALAGSIITAGIYQTAAVLATLALIVWPTGDVRAALSAGTEVSEAGDNYLIHYPVAEFIRLYYPDDVVAVNDLGVMSYYTDAHIIDMAGLGDVEPARILRRTGSYSRDDVRVWVEARGARIAIVQLDWSWIISRLPGWRQVAEVTTPTGARIGIFAVDPGVVDTLQTAIRQYFGDRMRGSGMQFHVL